MARKIEIKSEVNKKKEQGKQARREEIIEKKKENERKQDENTILKKKLKKKDMENKHIKQENKKLKDEYLRKMAEMENLRKRLDREKTEFYQYALSETLKEFLNVLDNFERALESQNQGDGKSFREGIEMIYKQFQDLLFKQGINQIEIKDKKFDPNLHQAFMTEESEDVEEPEVGEELQRGYTLHDRLLRPALVKVVVPKKEK